MRFHSNQAANFTICFFFFHMKYKISLTLSSLFLNSRKSMNFILIVTCITHVWYLLEVAMAMDTSLTLYNASRSSTGGGKDIANNAVDRDLSTFRHTEPERWNWLQVSLGSRHCIFRVTVINREHACCNQRFVLDTLLFQNSKFK